MENKFVSFIAFTVTFQVITQVSAFLDCSPCAVPSAPLSFLPVPQPFPIRVPPPCPPQSVTIPNIIVALLPPNQRTVAPCPRPIGPPSLVVPIPSPKPVLIPSHDNGCAC